MNKTYNEDNLNSPYVLPSFMLMDILKTTITVLFFKQSNSNPLYQSTLVWNLLLLLTPYRCLHNIIVSHKEPFENWIGAVEAFDSSCHKTLYISFVLLFWRRNRRYFSVIFYASQYSCDSCPFRRTWILLNSLTSLN